MFTMRRTVEIGVTKCTGLFKPIRIGPTVMQLVAFARVKC